MKFKTRLIQNPAFIGKPEVSLDTNQILSFFDKVIFKMFMTFFLDANMIAGLFELFLGGTTTL